MPENETIVAVFDTAEHAAAAVQDLKTAGVPDTHITQHAGGTAATSGVTGVTTSSEPRQEQGFWASLFGAEPEYGHDTAVYDRSLQGGSTVVTVRGSGSHLDQVLDILERHNPIDIDERAASYGVSQTSGTGAMAGTGTAAGYSGSTASTGSTAGYTGATAAPSPATASATRRSKSPKPPRKPSSPRRRASRKRWSSARKRPTAPRPCVTPCAARTWRSPRSRARPRPAARPPEPAPPAPPRPTSRPSRLG